MMTPDLRLPASPGASSTAKIPWAFACRELNGDSYLLLVDLLAIDTGEVVMEKMRAQYHHLMPSGWAQSIISPFTKAMLGTGVVDVSLFSEHQAVRPS